jgi:hypothetical protein
MSAASSLAPSQLPKGIRRSVVLRILGKVGYAARALLFAVLGVLVILTGFGLKHSHNDPVGALQAIDDAPFGHMLTGIVGIGLVAYAVWNFAVGVATAMGAHRRVIVGVGYALTGICYAPLAWAALSLAFGERMRGPLHFGGLFSSPHGPAIVAAIGVALLAAAIVQLVIGLGRTFVEPLDLRSLSDRVRHSVVALGAVGFVARGGLFGLVGGCLVRAWKNDDANEAYGPDHVIDVVLTLPHGLVFLLPLGIGLVAFGLFSIVAVRFLPK